MGSDRNRYIWHSVTNEQTKNVGCSPQEDRPFFVVHGHRHEQMVSQSGDDNFFTTVHLVVHYLGCGFPPDDVEVRIIADESGCRG